MSMTNDLITTSASHSTAIVLCMRLCHPSYYYDITAAHRDVNVDHLLFPILGPTTVHRHNHHIHRHGVSLAEEKPFPIAWGQSQ